MLQVTVEEVVRTKASDDWFGAASATVAEAVGGMAARHVARC